MRALFIFTTFLGSLLLFLIQPLIAKSILPNFGGTPAVWNTSLVFFQLLLLAGYAYAHYARRPLGTRLHAVVHLVLFAAAAFTLPFGVEAAFNPTQSGLPLWLVLLRFLFVAVGLPYFMVSAGAPLLQSWFARTNDPLASRPYFLYAASNAGSMLALLAYPLWFEREFDLHRQSELWSYGFFLLALLLGACALVSLSTRGDEAPPTPESKPIELGQKLRWIALAAVPSSLLMGVTTYLTTNVAAIPMLWVVPLALYLLTYILAFKSRRWGTSAGIGRWAALLLAPMTLLILLESTDFFEIICLFHLGVFFLACLMCHSELAETAPPADRLTEFYLLISVGGAIGGVFNAIVAPSVFKTLAEYPIALVAVMALRWRPSERPFKWRELIWPAVVAGVTLIAWQISIWTKMPHDQLRTGLIMGLPALLCFVAIDSGLRYAASLGALLFLGTVLGFNVKGNLMFLERSFFGVHRVSQNGDWRELVHGNTLHGRQNQQAENRKTPLTYYYPNGPVGVAIQKVLEGRSEADIGIVGLGVGSMAAYARRGDTVTFFEIDPTVIYIARESGLFTFLPDCKGSVRIVQGDARLLMRDEPDRSFDFLVIDAFSSDSIPIHLITLEALQLYLSKLKPTGILALHVSNRYLDLEMVLRGSAERLGVPALIGSDFFLSDDDSKIGKSPSQYVFFAKDEKAIAPLAKLSTFEGIDIVPKARPWTDARSNLLEVWRKPAFLGGED